jgi:hypothetical protein
MDQSDFDTIDAYLQKLDNLVRPRRQRGPCENAVLRARYPGVQFGLQPHATHFKGDAATYEGEVAW